MMVVAHNLLALNSERQLNIREKSKAKSTEKLSSGYKINRAADDAAGLAISEKMRRQIRGLTQASENAQDGISMVQTAEGAMEEIHAMLQRSNELAVKAANGTLSNSDRSMVDAEVQQLKKAIDETAGYTVFNEIELFPSHGALPALSLGNEVYHYELSYRLSDGAIFVGSDRSGITGSGKAGGNIYSGSVLADKIANEFLPNAVKQIFDAFPSLKTATGSDTIDMALDLSFLDGPGNTLAYAQYSFGSSGRPVSMLLKVDSDDFNDADANGTGSSAEELESTLAHELMHTVMQYNMTDGMSGRTGDAYPTWFVEGTAQLAGGGFPTGWNGYLKSVANHLAGATDNTLDSNIADYLNDYTVAGRPYGHGYLAAAYVGYLANGGGDVTAANIAAGMNKVFTDLINGTSFSAALANHTGGLTESGIESLFATGDTNLVEFVRKLSYASRDGAGSVIAGSLGTGGTGILGNTASIQQFRIDPAQVNVDPSLITYSVNGTDVSLQVGAESGTGITLKLYRMDAEALGLGNTNTKTIEDAEYAITTIKKAIENVSRVRSYYGAVQNRLEHTIANLDNIVENTTAAESAIRDADMAELMVEYSNQNILAQAGQAMLSQANQQQDIILGLLG